MLNLLEDQDGQYVIEFEDEDNPHACTFTVSEVNALLDDDSPDPDDLKNVIRGSIKWDGCWNIWVGESEGDTYDGYLHFCGIDGMIRFQRLLDAIWAVCVPRIKRFDARTTPTPQTEPS